MPATRQLSPGYQPVETIDVSASKRLLVLLNLAALAIMPLAAWLFFQAALWLRPAQISASMEWFAIRQPANMFMVLLAILALAVAPVVLHEALHGIFFWWFTRAIPKFAFKGAYAYAAAPGWYLPRAPFLATALAPLVGISLFGLLIIAAAPPAWILPTWMAVTFNAAGAVGDLYVVLRLLRRPASTFVQDRGDGVTFFVPGEN